MSHSTIHRLCALAALGVLLAGCAAAPAIDSRPSSSLYRCDRNGDLEQREAC